MRRCQLWCVRPNSPTVMIMLVSYSTSLLLQVGVDGAVFVHASGFIGGHKTKEGCLRMAVQVRTSHPLSLIPTPVIFLQSYISPHLSLNLGLVARVGDSAWNEGWTNDLKLCPILRVRLSSGDLGAYRINFPWWSIHGFLSIFWRYYPPCVKRLKVSVRIHQMHFPISSIRRCTLVGNLSVYSLPKIFEWDTKYARTGKFFTTA